jgi:hypothetical protein
LIDREIDEEIGKSLLGIDKLMSPSVKHGIAIAVVKQANPEAGVRSIQKEVMKKMTEELMHSCLLETGGITRGSTVQFGVDNDGEQIAFRMVGFADPILDQKVEDDGTMVELRDVFG